MSHPSHRFGVKGDNLNLEPDLMGELVGALRNFITRDLLYVVGGGSVIFCFLYLFDRIPDSTAIPTAVWLFVAGVAYTVGYALQEGLAFTGLVTSAYIRKPGSIVKWLYRRFTHGEWVEPNFDSVDQAEITVTAYGPPETLVELRRLISLRQIGTTMGSCGLISAGLLTIKACCSRSTFDFTTAAAVFVLAVVLSALGWLKAAQHTQYLRHLLPEAELRRLDKQRLPA